MVIKKYGTPEVIKDKITSEIEFEKMKDRIAKENNLTRCKKCGKLVAKSDSNIIHVKKGSFDMIASVKEASVKCPKCGEINIIEVGEKKS